MPKQSCGQSVSALRGKAGARLDAHTESRAKRQRSAREMKYRHRPVGVAALPGGSYSNWWCSIFNSDLPLSMAGGITQCTATRNTR